jgi:PHD/YefM family antitoxin component YafN of YafNO toxin-antitoxin module
MIRRMAEEDVRDNLEALLDVINASDELVIIQRQGIPVGGLVTSRDIEELRERRVAEAWDAFDENTKRTGVMDEDVLMDLVTEEVKVVRAERYAEQMRNESEQTDGTSNR